MNALIAFISARFEVLLDEKNAVLKSQKAEIILDVSNPFSKRWRRKMEAANRWIMLQDPAASLNADDHGSDPEELQNLSRATKVDSNQKGSEEG